MTRTMFAAGLAVPLLLAAAVPAVAVPTRGALPATAATNAAPTNATSTNATSTNAISTNAMSPTSASAPSLASAPKACPKGKGVTVVVDFGATSKIGCAAGDPTSGLTALRSSGFTVAMVARFPGMVCRINGIPTPAQDACVVAPPTTKYWSYWHATRGGKWTYSSVGAGSYNPKPGTVEGWSFGAGKAPSTPPPALLGADRGGHGQLP